MFPPKLAPGLAGLSALLALNISAQTPSPPIAPASTPAAKVSAEAAQGVVSPGPTPFRSALEGYQAYTDDKLVVWKEANDTVGKVGGWRAYAKEAQSPAAGASAPATGSTAPAAGAANPHAGHGKQ